MPDIAPRAVVFVGPSLRAAERPVAPGVATRPPIRRGDLRALLAAHPTLEAVGILDGTFHQTLAVTPREVLAALRAGVVVLGGASMGALRAAELHAYGMRGVGEVFALYASGAVTADDEVAIVFDPATERPLCEPLVNVRCAVRRGVAAGALSPAAGAAVVAAAAALPYAERVYPRILQHAGARLGADLRGLHAALAAHDQKRDDALALYAALAGVLAAEARRAV